MPTKNTMQYKPPELLDLPSPEQLMAFRGLCSSLRDIPRSVSPREQAAFRDLILDLCPGTGESWEYEMIEHLFPAEWKQYCQWEWGTPAELRADEEAQLLAQGWVRNPDGEMYFPYP
jgi:hypothetical protein